MKLMLSKLFKRPRTFIPESWTGLWIDKTGRSINIKEDKPKSYLITIRDKHNCYYSIHLLEDEKVYTKDLIGTLSSDDENRSYLEVEAGIQGLGPVLKLYFVVETDSEAIRLAQDNDNIDTVRIRPSVGMGLYDDWDDDLGVPWAYPLEYYIKKNKVL